MTSLDVIGRSHRDAPVLRYDPNRDELAALLDGEPRYRLDQVWAGIHERGEEIDDLTNLPKALRARLTDELPLALTPEVESISDDGDTVKWLWRLHDGHKIETVLMHYDDRTTVCVSSQAGCAMACGFCVHMSGHSRSSGDDTGGALGAGRPMMALRRRAEHRELFVISCTNFATFRE